ncbi:MAG: glycosyltransferase family 2 protein [Bacteroidaceae bacterium]|nr:glycosyltransferase family 2 protein [Bacteroidaceae bacterium]
MKVSVIIVNYKTPRLTIECIDSVKAHTRATNYEIVVVDNASGDGSVSDIRAAHPDVTVVESPGNIGFGRANNLGYEHCTGDYIFLLNSDTLLVNDAIHILATFLETHPTAGIAGGTLTNAEGRMVSSYKEFLPSLFCEFDNMLHGPFRWWAKRRVRRELTANGHAEVGFITGADMMLRRQWVEQVGMFDPAFFMYYEETDMTRRYTRAGLPSFFVPAARIIHLESQSVTNSEKKIRMMTTSRKLYYRKAHGRFYYWLCNLCYTLNLSKGIVVNTLMGHKAVVQESRLQLKCLFT